MADALGVDQVVVGGLSKGGEAALLVASHVPERIAGVISWSGSPVAWQGIGPEGEGRSSWTIGGSPVPFLRFEADAVERRLPLRLAPGYEAALDHQDVGAAAFPLGRVRGPVLLLSGTDDALWPSVQLHQRAAEALRQRPSGRVTNLAFRGAGYPLGPPGRPTTTVVATHPALGVPVSVGGSARATAEARARSWPAVLDLLAAAPTG